MQRGDARSLLIAAGIGLMGIAVLAPLTGSRHTSASTAILPAAVTDPSAATAQSVAATASVAPTDSAPAAVAPATDAATNSVPATDPGASTPAAATSGDLGNNEDGCVITERSLRVGSQGTSVTCLQEALTAAGYYSGAITGSYDGNTDAAVRALQTKKDLFVDGMAGRETGLALGIWPDEAKLVVHTPAPPAGAVDLMGYPLSTVASAGSDAPPLPENSGSGKRLVYSRAGQRVWAVDSKERIVRSWLVSGSKYGNELPGTHEVYSRSEVTTAWNGKAYLKKMVRWLKTERGNIGFHSIPIHVADGTVYQTEKELGQRLSGGCQRQAPLDAAFVWDFAQVGTKVVVI
jgi:hypothetical protein